MERKDVHRCSTIVLRHGRLFVFLWINDDHINSDVKLEHRSDLQSCRVDIEPCTKIVSLTNMSIDLLNRRLSFLASFFVLVAVLLGAIALGTNYWTLNKVESPNRAVELVNGTLLLDGAKRVDFNVSPMKWFIRMRLVHLFSRSQGLFYACSNGNSLECQTRLIVSPLILCLLALILLLISGVFLSWDVFRMSDRRFVIPMMLFVSCVLLTSGLVDYGADRLLNSHSSRLMICSLVFAYTVLPIASFVAGRHSTLNKFVNNEQTASGQKFLSPSNGNWTTEKDVRLVELCSKSQMKSCFRKKNTSLKWIQLVQLKINLCSSCLDRKWKSVSLEWPVGHALSEMRFERWFIKHVERRSFSLFIFEREDSFESVDLGL